jgi:two-component system sensor histidine kinase BaeS
VSLLGRVGLRAQLALALVAVALLGIGIATVLSNRGLPGRVNAAAHARLERQAWHMASVAAAFYLQAGRWTPNARAVVVHDATMGGIQAEQLDLRGRRIGGRDLARADVRTTTVRVPVLARGRRVGTLVVEPLGSLLTPEEKHLKHSLDRMHLAAAGISALAALVLALLLAETLARPLRRIRGVADLAHELRTPVNGVLARIEAAQDGVLADEWANLEAMHDETLRLVRLLDDLGRLSEAERPGLLVEKEPVDLGEVAAEQAQAFSAAFADKEIGVEASLASARVLGDPLRLGQVVSNLLSNALRYTPAGGDVRLEVSSNASEAHLEVRDSGIGIAPDDLRHIFKRFWRSEKSRSRATGGAGIGLAIVAELVQAHDGRIDVESKPGAGSTFRVSIPLLRG